MELFNESFPEGTAVTQYLLDATEINFKVPHDNIAELKEEPGQAISGQSSNKGMYLVMLAIALVLVLVCLTQWPSVVAICTKIISSTTLTVAVGTSLLAIFTGATLYFTRSETNKYIQTIADPDDTPPAALNSKGKTIHPADDTSAASTTSPAEEKMDDSASMT